MSQNSLQNAPFHIENGAPSDNLSIQNSASRHVVKCLSCGAYYRGANIGTGALSLVRHWTDARKFSVKTAAETLAFLQREFTGFAWAAVPFGGTQ